MSQPGSNSVNIDGLVYLLNQSGLALAQANARIGELEAQLAELNGHREEKHAQRGPE
jgi:hypothetical protein